MPKPTPSLNAWSAMDHAAQQEIPSGDPRQAELWAYVDGYTFVADQKVAVKVHTTAATYDLQVFRDGCVPVEVHSATRLAGRMQVTPDNAYEVGCGWEDTYTFTTRETWNPGVYLIVLTAEVNGQHLDTETFFVLQSTEPGSLSATVLVLSTATYVAYNDWGGANAYRRTLNGIASDEPAPRLSLSRPLARGFLRLPEGAPRYADSPELPPFGHPRYPWLEWSFAYGYSRHCRDAGWATYDRPFAHWAEREGFVLEYLTQHDLHADPDCLAPYQNVVLVGHDEYWTSQMRDVIDRHVDGGRNVSRFGANFLWQVRLEEQGRTQICYKDPLADPVFKGNDPQSTSTAWDFEFIGRPGASTLGLTGMGGIYTRFGTGAGRAAGGLTVYRPEHWVFDDTDLYYGDMFGHPSKIVSFEVDGVDYTFLKGLPYPTHADGAPQNLEILAMAPAVRGEINRRGYLLNGPVDDAGALLAASAAGIRLRQHESLEDNIHGAAMVAVFSRNGGTVFNSGTSEWVNGLIQNDFFVSQITRNVLRRLGATSVRGHGH